MNLYRLGVALGLAACIGCASVQEGMPPAVTDFDAARYMGTWHEIARLPFRFERGMADVTAEYSLDDGRLRVVNSGMKDGKRKEARAVGGFSGKADVAEFRISFFRPFYAIYRVIWLSPEYDVAMVTGGDFSTLWILSRKPSVDSALLEELTAKAKAWGFDISKLEFPSGRN